MQLNDRKLKMLPKQTIISYLLWLANGHHQVAASSTCAGGEDGRSNGNTPLGHVDCLLPYWWLLLAETRTPAACWFLKQVTIFRSFIAMKKKKSFMFINCGNT